MLGHCLLPFDALCVTHWYSSRKRRWLTSSLKQAEPASSSSTSGMQSQKRTTGFTGHPKRISSRDFLQSHGLLICKDAPAIPTAVAARRDAWPSVSSSQPFPLPQIARRDTSVIGSTGCITVPPSSHAREHQLVSCHSVLSVTLAMCITLLLKQPVLLLSAQFRLRQDGAEDSENLRYG